MLQADGTIAQKALQFLLPILTDTCEATYIVAAYTDQLH